MAKSPFELLNSIAQAIYDKKGSNILALDVQGISTLTDFILIAEGNVDRHVSAIGHAVIEDLRERGERPVHVEGMQSGDWVVIDYVTVMVHIFGPGMRDKYSLEKLFDCSLKELQEIKGIGPSKAMQILAISELGKRHNNSRNPIKKITCARDVYEHFKEKLKDEKQENFFVLILNNANNIVKEELVSKGVLDAAILHPREVFKPAIKNSASKIILVHNHPSGNSQPSLDDLEITKQLIEAGKLLDIKVLDHVIVGGEGWWSWKEDKG